MRLDKIKIDKKIVIGIFVTLAIVAGYFIYKSFFTGDGELANSASDAYVGATKIGGLVDILNKENVSFNTNINNEILNNAQDFSVQIDPSESVGRSNPFLP